MALIASCRARNRVLGEREKTGGAIRFELYPAAEPRRRAPVFKGD